MSKQLLEKEESEERHCAHHHHLEVENLCVSYGNTPALREIHFEMSCGSGLALVGANGAGKSSLLKVLAGLIRADHGVLRWRGEDLLHGSSEIAYLPQRGQVDWNFPATVRHVVEMGRYAQLGWWRKFGNKDAQAVEQALESMNLLDVQDRQIGALSGGQQQRSFLARALAQKAHVFLLDEPFTGLDAASSEMLAELMQELMGKGHLIIASHHNLKTVADIFPQALLLNERQVAFGKSEEVMNEENIALAMADRHSNEMADRHQYSAHREVERGGQI